MRVSPAYVPSHPHPKVSSSLYLASHHSLPGSFHSHSPVSLLLKISSDEDVSCNIYLAYLSFWIKHLFGLIQGFISDLATLDIMFDFETGCQKGRVEPAAYLKYCFSFIPSSSSHFNHTYSKPLLSCWWTRQQL